MGDDLSKDDKRIIDDFEIESFGADDLQDIFSVLQKALGAMGYSREEQIETFSKFLALSIHEVNSDHKQAHRMIDITLANLSQQSDAYDRKVKECREFSGSSDDGFFLPVEMLPENNH